MEIILKNSLNAEDVRGLTERLLREHLSLEVAGYSLTTSMALNVLLKAAIERRSIEAVCADLAEVVDSNTLREALNRALTVAATARSGIQCGLGGLLAQRHASAGFGDGADFHDEPFYGKTEALRAYTVRGEAREGTIYFFASLYGMWRGVRLTLALTYVLPKETTLSILQRLFQRQEELGFRPKVLYLDKGFCRGDIIDYLQQTNLPTVIACPIRGKEGKGGGGPYVAGVKRAVPATPLPMGRRRIWRWFPLSNATARRASPCPYQLAQPRFALFLPRPCC